MKDQLIQRIDGMIGVLCIAVSLGAYALFGPIAALGVTVGAVLGGINFIALRTIMRRVFTRKQDRTSSTWAATLGAKFLVFAALIYAAVSVLQLPAIAFTVGISLVPVAVVIEAVRFNAAADADQQDPDALAASTRLP